MSSRSDRPRALVVGPAFFGYERDIVRELSAQGFDAEFFDERPSNSSVARAVVRARPSLISRRINAHFRAAESRFRGRTYALVLVIKAEVVPRWFLESLRAMNPDARFVFYTYDSINNSSACLELVDCFDELLSFDRDDVARYQSFSYLPLFYTSDFIPEAGSATPRRHDLAFVGTLHSERYGFVKQLFQGRPRSHAFFYVQARWYFAFVKYLTREHRDVRWREVSFVPLDRHVIAATFRESFAVLDMQRSGQSGLTMRTFEVLAAGAVLVTTNAAIVQEPFYDPERIIVVPPDLASLDSKAVHAALDALVAPIGRPAGFERYSLSSWVHTIADH